MVVAEPVGRGGDGDEVVDGRVDLPLAVGPRQQDDYRCDNSDPHDTSETTCRDWSRWRSAWSDVRFPDAVKPQRYVDVGATQSWAASCRSGAASSPALRSSSSSASGMPSAMKSVPGTVSG